MNSEKKNRFFCRIHFFTIFFTFFKISKSEFSRFWRCAWSFIIGNPIQNGPGRRPKSLCDGFFQKSILRTAVFRTLRGIPTIKMVFMIDLMDFYAEKSFLAMPLALSDASALASLQHFEVFSLNALFLHCAHSAEERN